MFILNSATGSEWMALSGTAMTTTSPNSAAFCAADLTANHRTQAEKSLGPRELLNMTS
jgi:hypothetical protein